MPLYEYKCNKCLRIIPKWFPIDRFPKSVTCEKCGRQAIKMMSVSSYRMKGYSEKNGYSKER